MEPQDSTGQAEPMDVGGSQPKLADDAADKPKRVRKKAEVAAPVRQSTRVRVQRKIEDIDALGGTPARKKAEVLHFTDARKHGEEDKVEVAATATGKWTVKDDLLLKQSVEHLQDMRAVFEQVKFSRNYSLDNIINRWHALLYGDDTAGLIKEVLKGRGVKVTNTRAPFGVLEEELLRTAALEQLNSSGSIDFEAILTAYRNNFHCSRTADSLKEHFGRMKAVDDSLSVPYAALEFTTGQSHHTFKAPQSIFKHLASEDTENFGRSLKRMERRHRRHVAQLTADINGDWDGEEARTSLAMFKGTNLKVFMKSKEISIGRSSEHVKADVDLTRDNNQSLKSVSRKQAVVKLKRDGQFYIKNTGKHSVTLNGRTVPPQKVRHLKPSSVLEFVGIKIVFEPNRHLLSKIRRYVQRPQVEAIDAELRQIDPEENGGGTDMTGKTGKRQAEGSIKASVTKKIKVAN